MAWSGLEGTDRGAIIDRSLVFLGCFSRHSASDPSAYENKELAVAVEQLRLRGPANQTVTTDADHPDLCAA